MKRVLFVATCILALCSLLILDTGTVKATEPGYERTDWNPDTVPLVIDGEWTTDDEWTLKGENTAIDMNVTFKSVWEMVSMDPVFIIEESFLVEFFTDNSNDTGDYWEMCINGDRSDDATPQAGDFRIFIEGHTNLTVYEGNGVDWTKITTPASIEWADSISDSPTNSTPHWILEIKFEKGDVGAAEYWDFRLAAYDETNDTLASWPPTDRDVPNSWGFQTYQSAVVPEGFSIALVVLLSSVAIAVSFYCLRKPKKTQSYSSAKTEEINTL